MKFSVSFSCIYLIDYRETEVPNCALVSQRGWRFSWKRPSSGIFRWCFHQISRRNTTTSALFGALILRTSQFTKQHNSWRWKRRWGLKAAFAISKIELWNLSCCWTLLNRCSSSAVFVSVSMFTSAKRNKSVASVFSFGNNRL